MAEKQCRTVGGAVDGNWGHFISIGDYPTLAR